MIEPRLFICSGAQMDASHPLRSGRRAIELDSIGPDANVNLQLDNVAKVLLQHLRPRLVDLLEIAAYVFTADCSTQRDGAWTDDHATEPWGRDFQFVLPVRDLDFWDSADVKQALKEMLHFLSNDQYNFAFQQLSHDRPVQEYLQFGDDDWPFRRVERILMFSGGLDSLAGAVETAAGGGKLVLVSHRPVSTLDSRQRELFKQLQSTFPELQMIHVPVWVNKDKHFGREHYQRTRSFLYSAIGMVVGESIEAGGVRFFENGIVSLNLPPADEVLRARASRTTHPMTLQYFSKLYQLVTGRAFEVDNPYIFKTKKEVLEVIAGHDACHLIRHTCSCAHTGIFKPKSQWHCGTCSQCIDRRIAIIAAGLEDYDPETDYQSPVFTGPRAEGYDRNIAVDYVHHAFELRQMSAETISAQFNAQLSRAVRPFPRRLEVAERFVDLHRRHSETVCMVVKDQLSKHTGELFEGKLDDTCMLALVAGQQHLGASWKRYADRIIQLLTTGLPVACQSHKPMNEPHLQELCDAILQANETILVREYPLLGWSSRKTKPDWSAEPLRLWVELKYVREAKDIRQITEDIAADITKYGDNDRRTLFVIYDPYHLITDQEAFAEPILKRPTMLVGFVR